MTGRGAARAAGARAEILAGTDIETQRAVLSDLIERILPERVGYAKYEARITWTLLGRALGQFREAVGAALVLVRDYF